MIDPLAGLWTVGRNRKRGKRRLARKPPSAGPTATAALDLDRELELEAGLDLGTEPDLADDSGTDDSDVDDSDVDDYDDVDSGADDKPGPPADDSPPPTSYLDAKPPYLTRSRRTRRPRRRWSARYLVAVPLLVLLVLTGIGLTGVIVGLAKVGINPATNAATAQSPLAVPAPGVAAGLPRRTSPVRSPAMQPLIAEFIQRFTAVTGSLSGQPAALYREPGTIDLASNETGWVMYLGHNWAASPGAAAATIDKVMAALTGTTAPNSFWSVAPGPRGGSARCAIASFGTTTVSLCAWATADTVGALMSPTAVTRGNELATLMSLMRVDLQPGPRVPPPG